MRILLAIILSCTLFVTSLSAQEQQGTLKQIQDSGIFRIGYRQSQPPMSSLGKDNVPGGYSIDICHFIAKRVESKLGRGVTIEYIPVTAEERFEALVANKIDILCGSTTVTFERREHVDFTQLTFVTGGSYLTLKGRDIRNNFDGKKLGVVKGTTTAVALKKLFQETETKVDIVLLDSTDKGFDALKKGEIDILSADQVVLIGLVLQANNPGEFAILPDMFSYEPFALAVRKNDADFRLVADRAISHLYQSNEIEAVYDRWFGQFATKMPAALQALIKLNIIADE